MAIDLDQVNNLNIASSNNFYFELKELPAVSMFAKKFQLPGVSMERVIQPTPLVHLSHPGTSVDFDDLEITFLVDEHLSNYREIWRWMMHLGFPQSTEQYKMLALDQTQYSVRSDIAVHLLTNKFNATHAVKFIDAFPVGLSGIEFSNDEDDILHPTATATFDYSYYIFSDDTAMPDFLEEV